MNIFYLDADPVLAAQMQADKHVIKMALESTQILSTVLGGPYKPTHKNHPSVLWAAKHVGWTLEHQKALLAEYTYRYGKVHKCAEISFTPDLSKDEPFVPPPMCMPEEFRQENVIEAYRAYYRGGKAHIAKWNRGREPPSWWTAA